jgi:hypothetical protein
MKDWEERDRSWAKYRREVEMGNRVKLARQLGVGSVIGVRGRNVEDPLLVTMWRRCASKVH